MNKTTTLRLPEQLLKEISKFVKEAKLERSAYLREIIHKGFELDKRERILDRYERGELSLSESCRKLNTDAWAFLQMLKDSNRNVSVSLEDMLDSAPL
jgi:metal-responsive CopG/Arc/MetJ family transcriptional regulator